MTPGAEAPAAARRVPELTLLAITVFWGFTFILVQLGLRHSGPFFLVGLRFGAATLSLLALTGFRPGRPTAVEWRAGLLIGAGMVACYVFQTIGLMTIASSKSAFITAIYVPLVPLIELAAFRRMPVPAVWLGIALAFGGLLLLAGPDQLAALRFGRGEVLTLLGAIATAIQIVQIGVFAPRIDARRASLIQTGSCALCSFALMPVVGESAPALSWPLLAVAVGLGTASALVQLAMNWAQRSVSASRAALIYAGEPVYAGIIGRVAGERLPALALIGAAMVVGSVVVSEWRPRRKAAEV